MSTRTLTEYEAARLILAAKAAGYLLSADPIVRNRQGQALAIRLRYRRGRGSVMWAPHRNDEQAFRLMIDAGSRGLQASLFETYEAARWIIIAHAANKAKEGAA